MTIFVTLTFAQRIDGKIATTTGASRYISETASLQLNQQMRMEHDAILVGIGTVLRDDPLLTCRIVDGKNPVRVILDSSLGLPPDSQIARTASAVKTVVFHGPVDEISSSRLESLHTLNIVTKEVATSSEDRLDLLMVLEELERMGISTLMVEGGAAVLTSFVRQDLWDEMVICSAPKIIGSGISPFSRLGVESLEDIIAPVVSDIRIMGNEVVWRLNRRVSEQSVRSRSVYFSAPRKVAVHDDIIRPRSPKDRLFQSRIMGISPGTERQFYAGNFEQNVMSDPSIDCIQTQFTYPFQYGYINVLEDEQKKRFFGFLPHSEKVYTDYENLLALDEDLSDETALFIPHMETALSILHDTKPLIGDRILIVGAGVVGTLTQRLLTQIMGIETVVFDINGLKKAWFPNNNFLESPAHVKTDRHFDKCIDTSGSSKGLQQCIDSCCFEGQITVASWFGEREISLNLGGSFHRKRLSLKSSQVSTLPPSIGSCWNKSRRLAKSIELLKQVDVSDLLTHRFPLSDAESAFRILDSRDTLYGLIALIPGE